ncbi:MAG TPA: RagB/SusD family nutrient uptake outer membrane protein, partial [Flavobacterium sp.]|nr:RagB/SusD family nutrient uptake outer membrane protein [Flavobacterium sp.]
MKNLKLKLAALASVMLVCWVSVSCVDDLDQAPEDSSSLLTSEEFFNNPESYKQFLAKLYAGLATTGQSGPAGSPDISFIDEGFSQYIRGYWNMQELTTDEAIIAWNDLTIKNFHFHNWTQTDVFINATFSRLAFQVTNCNEFLRQTTDAKLDGRGVSGDLRAQIQVYRAEARFLRALSYWHLIDLFGGAAIVSEDSPSTYFLPEYANRQQLFDFVETELADIEDDLADPNSNEAFRIDRAALWMLQGKLYMNAGVYVGTDRYNDAQIALEKIFNQSSYTLHDNYRELFLADNDTNGAQNEFIFAVNFDGINTKTFGGTTYLTHAPVGGSMQASEFGINGGWAGIRT